MAWYDKDLWAYNHRSKEEKEKERRQDEQWWNRFLAGSPIAYQRRHNTRVCNQLDQRESSISKKLKKLYEEGPEKIKKPRGAKKEAV